ncbi:MAG: tetratricopeptide repeat protein [Candidatus Lernaella stagnicola]|nr:tetratricopeptide repeat protein [Candidatus Lernaella stagnicola]
MGKQRWTIFVISLGILALVGCATTEKNAKKRVDELSAQVTELQATLADMNLRMEEMSSSMFVLREGTRNNREAINKMREDMQTPTVYIDRPQVTADAGNPSLDTNPEPMSPLPLPTGSGQPDADDRAAFESAMRQVKQQNWGLAIYDLNAFVTQYPQSAYIPQARYALGQTYRNLGEFTQAVREYERCLAAGEVAGPYAPRALYWMVVCFGQLGQTAKGNEAQQRLLQQYPDSPEAKKIKLDSPR